MLFFNVFNEYSDMIMCVGEAFGISQHAVDLYHGKYPNRRLSTSITITDALQRLRDRYGKFSKSKC